MWWARDTIESPKMPTGRHCMFPATPRMPPIANMCVSKRAMMRTRS